MNSKKPSFGFYAGFKFQLSLGYVYASGQLMYEYAGSLRYRLVFTCVPNMRIYWSTTGLCKWLKVSIKQNLRHTWVAFNPGYLIYVHDKNYIEINHHVKISNRHFRI